MKTYIAFLRGINVSGKNLIKMVELKQLFIDCGFTKVTTYIQSGNVIFNVSETTTSKIEQTVIDAIRKKFDYEVKVLVISKNELERIFKSNPFIKNNAEIDISKLCVTMLSQKTDVKDLTPINELTVNSNDEFILDDKKIYLNCPSGYGKTKLTNNLFERKLKVAATTRNWKTITKLVELSNQ